jgi:Na+-driven multidrug efflux pump
LPGSRRGSYLSMTSNIDSLEKKITFLQFAVTSIDKSVPLSIVRAFPSILNMFCFFWIGYFNERSMTAALGLSMSCYYFFCCMLILINGDCTGVVCTRHWAKSSHSNARIGYMRGQAVTTFILLIAVCGFYPRLDLILLSIGFPKDICDQTWLAAWASMPYIIICSYNECFRNYLISLSFKNVFHCSNVVAMLVGVPGSWFFIWYLRWGLVGAGAIKFLLEVFNFGLFYGVWRATGQEKSFRGNETFKDAFYCRAFWEYVVFFLKAAYGTWLEYFGVELFTI